MTTLLLAPSSPSGIHTLRHVLGISPPQWSSALRPLWLFSGEAEELCALGRGS